MTFSVGGLIEASDWNTQLVGSVNDTTSGRLNTLLGPGSGTYGYGQTQVPTVSVGDIVSSNISPISGWAALTDACRLLALQQNSTITAISNPSAGQKIAFNGTDNYTNLTNNLTTLTTNRLNAGSQGTTYTTTATTSASWKKFLTFTFTAQFSSADATRYFFNSGGQLSFTFSHPTSAGTINEMISDLASQSGTTYLSAPSSGTVVIAGSTFSGVTKVGGTAVSGSTINPNNGFYALTPSQQQLVVQKSSYTYIGPWANTSYGGTNLTITAAYNSVGLITAQATFDEIPDGTTVATTVTSGTVGTMTIRPPSTTYLTNTWGTATLSTNTSQA
jgi:hypothetical protein